MSWRKNSARNFHFDSYSTPYNVGPGSYDVEPVAKKSRPPSAAFKSREKRTTPFDKQRNKTPAPGRYETTEADKHIKITSSFKTNSERRFYDPNNNPSPADHSNLHDWVAKKPKPLPECVSNRPFSQYVGQDISGFDVLEDGSLQPKKLKHHDNRWIGPGSYNVEYAYGVGGHSMKESYRNSDPSNKDNFPGPGAYDTRKKKENQRPKTARRSASVKSARTSRKDPADDAPKSGELKHQPWNKEESDITLSHFKSRSKREIFVVKEKTPAPTNYQNTERKRPTSAKAAFGQRTPRFLDNNGNNVPGPGAYDAEDCMWITSTTPTGRHAYDAYRPGNGVPGPGTYETPTIWKNEKAEKQYSVFASSVPRDRQVGDVTPGPGTYTIEGQTGKKTKLSIHSSRSKKTNNFFELPTKQNPGPDHYYATDRSIGYKGKTIPHDSRFEKESRSPNPGPGTYKIEHGSLVKKSFNSDLIGVGE